MNQEDGWDAFDAPQLDLLRTLSDRICGTHLHTYVAPCAEHHIARYVVEIRRTLDAPDAPSEPSEPPEHIKRRIITVGVDYAALPGHYLLAAMSATPSTREQLSAFFPGVTEWRKVDGMQPISLGGLVGLN